MTAQSPVKLELGVNPIKIGDKLTVVWDGVSYDVIVKKVTSSSKEYLAFGNLALADFGEPEDYPFFYTDGLWIAADTSPSHTIKVMRQQVTITPMSTDFIPKNFNVVFSGGINSSIPDSCNVTYDELRGWIENGIPVFATYKYKQDDGSVSSVKNIINFEIGTDSLRVYYGSGANFKYNSDGTFSGSGVES